MSFAEIHSSFYRDSALGMSIHSFYFFITAIDFILGIRRNIWTKAWSKRLSHCSHCISSRSLISFSTWLLMVREEKRSLKVLAGDCRIMSQMVLGNNRRFSLSFLETH